MKSRNRLDSFKYAFEGLFYVIKTQKNVRIHFFCLFMIIILGLIFDISKNEWLAVLIVSVLVICLEVINTVVEEVVNLCIETYHPKAKIAKDAAAGAVLIAAAAAVFIGLIVFLPKIVKLIF
jgi:diacylglycerol kinase